MVQRHMKRYSISYTIREFQVKTTMRYSDVCIRKAKIETLTSSNAAEDAGATGTLIQCRMQNGTVTFKGSVVVSYKTEHTLTI